MTDQPALFPVDQTTDTVCRVCGTTRPAGQQTAADCQHDREREGRRPAACLNAYDPTYADIPY